MGLPLLFFLSFPQEICLFLNETPPPVACDGDDSIGNSALFVIRSTAEWRDLRFPKRFHKSWDSTTPKKDPG
jgi:hypothetical protein